METEKMRFLVGNYRTSCEILQELHRVKKVKTMISERPDISNDLDIMIQRIKHRDINKVSKAPKGRDLTTLIDYLDIYDDISIVSTGGSTVKASVDSVNLTFSIGKSF